MCIDKEGDKTFEDDVDIEYYNITLFESFFCINIFRLFSKYHVFQISPFNSFSKQPAHDVNRFNFAYNYI